MVYFTPLPDSLHEKVISFNFLLIYGQLRS